MNQLECLTILVDAARQLPETRHLVRAIKVAEKRRDVLRARYARRKLSIDAKSVVATCVECRELLARCNCWDETKNVMSRTLILCWDEKLHLIGKSPRG